MSKIQGSHATHHSHWKNRQFILPRSNPGIKEIKPNIYRDFGRTSSTQSQWKEKARRARLTATSSVVFTVQWLVVRQYFLALNYSLWLCSGSTWSLFSRWGIFIWTSLIDYGNICSSKKPKIAVKFYEHFDWVNTWSICRKWRSSESHVCHKSKGWTNKRRWSECQSKINFQGRLQEMRDNSVRTWYALTFYTVQSQAWSEHCPFSGQIRLKSRIFSSVLINNII